MMISAVAAAEECSQSYNHQLDAGVCSYCIKRKAMKDKESRTKTASSLKRTIAAKTQGRRCSPFLHLAYGYPYALGGGGCLPYGAVYFLFNLTMNFLRAVQLSTAASMGSKPSTKGLSSLAKGKPLSLYQMDEQVASLVEKIKGNVTRMSSVRHSFTLMVALIVWTLRKYADKPKKQMELVYGDRLRMQNMLTAYGPLLYLSSTMLERLRVDVDVVFTKYYAPCGKELAEELHDDGRITGNGFGTPFGFLDIPLKVQGARATALLAMLRNMSAHRQLDTPGVINLVKVKDTKTAAARGKEAARQIIYLGVKKVVAGKVFLIQLEEDVFSVVMVFLRRGIQNSSILFCNQLRASRLVQKASLLTAARDGVKQGLSMAGDKGSHEVHIQSKYPSDKEDPRKKFWGSGILPRDDLQLVLYTYTRLILGHTHSEGMEYLVQKGMMCPKKSVTHLRDMMGVTSESGGCYVSTKK